MGVFGWSIPVIISLNGMSLASPATAPAMRRTSRPSASTPQEVSAHGQRVKGPIAVRLPSERTASERTATLCESLWYELGMEMDGNGWNKKPLCIWEVCQESTVFLMWNDFEFSDVVVIEGQPPLLSWWLQVESLQNWGYLRYLIFTIGIPSYQPWEVIFVGSRVSLCVKSHVWSKPRSWWLKPEFYKSNPDKLAEFPKFVCKIS